MAAFAAQYMKAWGKSHHTKSFYEIHSSHVFILQQSCYSRIKRYGILYEICWILCKNM